MINNLTKVHPIELGGFRIEIRLKSRTLNQAGVTARSLPFFSIDSWLNPTEDEIKPFKLEAMAITKDQGGLTPKCRPNAGHRNSRDI